MNARNNARITTSKLAWGYMSLHPFSTLLNAVVLACGVAFLVCALLLHNQLAGYFGQHTQGIDAVVGAKGSPLQLILAGVFQTDVPTGNVDADALLSLAKHPDVARLIPLSIGDNWGGFRVVGTVSAYIAHHQTHGQNPSASVRLAKGNLWQIHTPMEAVLGAQVAKNQHANLGIFFVASHGLDKKKEQQQQEQQHRDFPYTVVGILPFCYCVLDNLILTDVSSVQEVHQKSHQNRNHKPQTHNQQITLGLVRYSSPLAAIRFPRFVNENTQMQAAIPAVEISRILQWLGSGTDVLGTLLLLGLVLAGMGVFLGFFNAMSARKTDCMWLRLLGCSPWRLVGVFLREALFLAGISVVFGILFGHGLMAWVATVLHQQSPFFAHLDWTVVDWQAEITLAFGAVLFVVLGMVVPVLKMIRMPLHGALKG